MLDQMWELHKTYLRRMLVGLSQNIDLADDLLQETYLRACDGIEGFRGGNARAWLAVIAKNVFYAHARRKSYGSEEPLDAEINADGSSVGSYDHLTQITLRQAVSDLKPNLRTAVVMRHYGGFSYKEIADHLSCPEGTARQRVWKAMQQLKVVLGDTEKERMAMRCSELRGTQLLDYLYSGLPDDKSAKIKQHLDECPACRKEAEELRKTMLLLDSVEGDWKMTKIIDLDENGVPYEYVWSIITNKFGRVMETAWWTINKSDAVDYATYLGEEVTFEVLPCSDTQYRYEARLPRPINPGEQIDNVLVLHPTNPECFAKKLEDGRWRYFYGTTPNSSKEWVFALAVRLPCGAKLVSAEPKPTEVKANGTTTLIWRSLLPRIKPRPDGTWPWQFECTIDYRL